MIKPKTIEDWKELGVEWNKNDGSASITLTYPINVGGTASTLVRMICPSEDQMEAIDNDKTGTALAQERRALSILMGMAPEEVGQIKVPDYRRVQMVYADFLSGTPPTFIGAGFAPQSGS